MVTLFLSTIDLLLLGRREGHCGVHCHWLHGAPGFAGQAHRADFGLYRFPRHRPLLAGLKKGWCEEGSGGVYRGKMVYREE